MYEVEDGEIHTKEEKDRLKTYSGIKKSIASNDEILNVKEENETKEKENDINAIIAKYINLKHKEDQNNNTINNNNNNNNNETKVNEEEMNESKRMRKRLEERDKELRDILYDKDPITDSNLSSSMTYSSLCFSSLLLLSSLFSYILYRRTPSHSRSVFTRSRYPIIQY